MTMQRMTRREDSTKHTRPIIGAEYNGTKYYYPVDFENTDTGELMFSKSYEIRNMCSI